MEYGSDFWIALTFALVFIACAAAASYALVRMIERAGEWAWYKLSMRNQNHKSGQRFWRFMPRDHLNN